MVLVRDLEWRLLQKRNVAQPELHNQRVFVGLFNDPMTKRIKHLDGAAHDLKNLLLGQQRVSSVFIRVRRLSYPFVFIRVHSCLTLQRIT